MKKLLFLMLIVVLTACSREDFDMQHMQYLSDKGWDIRQALENETRTSELAEEMLSNYDASGITFLRDYNGETVTEYVYELTDKDAEGEYLKAVIFEVDGEIVGGYGLLPSWTPGMFHLVTKDRLLEEQKIEG